MIYVDSSAIVKLVRLEEHSEALVSWLADRAGEALVTSVVAEVEVVRGLRRVAPGALGAVAETLDRFARIELDLEVRERAAALDHPALPTLDAIHLATALSLGDGVEALVAYDERLLEVASAAAIAVAAPGLGKYGQE